MKKILAIIFTALLLMSVCVGVFARVPDMEDRPDCPASPSGNHYPENIIAKVGDYWVVLRYCLNCGFVISETFEHI